jgi:hypothetical protein
MEGNALRIVDSGRTRRYDGELSALALDSLAQRYVDDTLADGHPGVGKFAGFAQNMRPTLDSGLCADG